MAGRSAAVRPWRNRRTSCAASRIVSRSFVNCITDEAQVVPVQRNDIVSSWSSASASWRWGISSRLIRLPLSEAPGWELLRQAGYRRIKPPGPFGAHGMADRHGAKENGTGLSPVPCPVVRTHRLRARSATFRNRKQEPAVHDRDDHRRRSGWDGAPVVRRSRERWRRGTAQDTIEAPYSRRLAARQLRQPRHPVRYLKGRRSASPWRETLSPRPPC